MSLVLGPLFDRPIHPPETPRQVGRYRITNQFDGPDLVNGGIHEATDVGDADAVPGPITAPADCLARGVRNGSETGTDALGVEFDLGDGVRLRLDHLSDTLPLPRVDPPPGRDVFGAWWRVEKGEVVGWTGNTGTTVVINGVRGPMPHHTHIKATRNGVPFDIEPYLFGRPLPIGEEETVKYKGWVEHVVNRQTTVRANETNLRAQPTTKSESLGQYDAGRSVVPHELYRGEPPKGSSDPTWYLVTMPSGADRVVGFFHASVLGKLVPIEEIDTGTRRIGKAAPHLETASRELAAALTALQG